MEDLRNLDNKLVQGFSDWVNNAPQNWKLDGFISQNSPVIVTSRYGQNAAIALEGNRSQEAAAWDRDRDYSKIAFLTVAIATSIKYVSLIPPFPFPPSSNHFPPFLNRCYEIHSWDPIPVHTLLAKNPGTIFDSPDRDTRRPIISDLHDYPLLDENDQEIFIYNSQGIRIPRRAILHDPSQPDCGVLINLRSAQGLFNPEIPPSLHADDYQPGPHQLDPYVRIEVYPLAFLKSAGNLKASGIPHSFYPLLTNINKSVRKNHPAPHPSFDPLHSPPHDDLTFQQDQVDLLDDETQFLDSVYQPLKPVSSQFYNYSTHRVASRAGNHDSQQATVTAAISGAYAKSDKDKKTAREKQKYCSHALPADRFHRRIHDVDDCPSSCRAELVYSVDVRALKVPSGSYVFPHLLISSSHHSCLLSSSIYDNIIYPLAHAWSQPDIRSAIKDHLVVFKPQVLFPFPFSPFPFLTLSHPLQLI